MPASIWKGVLAFGLVSIPVRLHRAARKERIPLHYVSRPKTSLPDRVQLSKTEQSYGQPSKNNVHPIRVEDGGLQGGAIAAADETFQPIPEVSRIRQSLITEDDEPIAPQEIRRGYEVAPGQYVTFEQPELERLRRPTSSTMEIVRSVRLAEIDPVFFETSYYVVPEPLGERAYGMLYSALRDTAYVALAKVAMHGRDHVVLIRPGQKGLLAHTMFYVNEVRPESESTAKAEVADPKELELAKAFVEAIAAPFGPEEFQDSHNQAIQELIAGKMDRSELATVTSDTSKTSAPSPAPVTDIMGALRRSLELRKPAVAETQPAKTGQSRRKPHKRA